MDENLFSQKMQIFIFQIFTKKKISINYNNSNNRNNNHKLQMKEKILLKCKNNYKNQQKLNKKILV